MPNPLSCLAYAASAPECERKDEGYEWTDPVPGHSYKVKYRVIRFNEDAPLVLYAGGNNEDLHACYLKCLGLSEFYGVNFAVFGLPGYGDTDSDELFRTDETGYHAIEAVYMKLHQRDDDMYVWGRSFGTSFAAYLASKHAFKGVILEAPIASGILYSATQDLDTNLGIVLRWVGRPLDGSFLEPWVDAFTTAEFAAQSGFHGAPTYIVYLENDHTLPPIHAERIYEAVRTKNPRAYRREIRGKDHNDAISFEEYNAAVPPDVFYPDRASPLELQGMSRD